MKYYHNPISDLDCVTDRQTDRENNKKMDDDDVIVLSFVTFEYTIQVWILMKIIANLVFVYVCMYVLRLVINFTIFIEIYCTEIYLIII